MMVPDSGLLFRPPCILLLLLLSARCIPFAFAHRD